MFSGPDKSVFVFELYTYGLVYVFKINADNSSPIASISVLL